MQAWSQIHTSRCEVPSGHTRSTGNMSIDWLCHVLKGLKLLLKMDHVFSFLFSPLCGMAREMQGHIAHFPSLMQNGFKGQESIDSAMTRSNGPLLYIVGRQRFGEKPCLFHSI